MNKIETQLIPDIIAQNPDHEFGVLKEIITAQHLANWMIKKLDRKYIIDFVNLYEKEYKKEFNKFEKNISGDWNNDEILTMLESDVKIDVKELVESGVGWALLVNQYHPIKDLKSWYFVRYYHKTGEIEQIMGDGDGNDTVSGLNDFGTVNVSKCVETNKKNGGVILAIDNQSYQQHSETEICTILSNASYEADYDGKSEYKSGDRISNELNKWKNVPKNYQILDSNKDMFAIDINNKLYFSFRGTANIRDVINDVTKVVFNVNGLGTRCETADKFVSSILAKYGNKYNRNDIMLTGHSLGGYVAEEVAIKHDLHAITFNTPGVKLKPEGWVRKSGKIKSLQINGDLVGSTLWGTPHGVPMCPTTKNENAANYHTLNNFISHQMRSSRSQDLTDMDKAISKEELEKLMQQAVDHDVMWK